MKKNIILLIVDDIKISRLLSILNSLDISASNYYLSNSKVIFNLLDITTSDENNDLYYTMIDLGKDVTKYNSSIKVIELAEEVYNRLYSISKAKSHVQ